MKKKVFFQGEHGAFSEEAAFTYFGKSIKTVPCKAFEDVFQAVRKNDSTFGIIPIENSLAGSLHINYDLLLTYKLKIIGEIFTRISHQLLGLRKTNIQNIKRIYSHPMALQQCQTFLRSLPSVEVIESYDTAGSVMILKDTGSREVAAIASKSAAKIYGVNILQKNIEDYKQNYTRFLILSKKQRTVVEDFAKTSIVFSLRNEPGVLFKSLSGFALRGIDLTKIESRPVREKPFEYYFYLDFIGSTKELGIKNALNSLREITDDIRILGSYKIFRK